MSRIFFSWFVLLLIAAPCGAQVQWTLTRADFQTQAVTLQSMDAEGVRVTATTGGDEKLVPFDDFLDLSRPIASGQSAGKFLLHLVGEDAIGGEPLSIKGNDLIWSNATLGEIAIPMKHLLAMARPGVAVPDARRRDDVVVLSNGDTLRGIITGFTAGKVTVQTEGGAASDVPIASVSQISFAATAATTPAATGFRVRLDDSSSVVATSLVVTGDKVTLALGKDAARPVDLARVAAIEQVNGPVSWLSSRQPTENVYIPFIGSTRTNAGKMNRNWNGQDTIRFGSQVFPHGIGVHSYSRVSWNLDGTYAALRTRYAIDTKEANTKADVTVRILLDGKPVYEQSHVRAGALSPVVVADLKGASKLTLEVDYGDNMDTQDRFNWIEPALLKHKPASDDHGTPAVP